MFTCRVQACVAMCVHLDVASVVLQGVNCLTPHILKLILLILLRR